MWLKEIVPGLGVVDITEYHLRHAVTMSQQCIILSQQEDECGHQAH